MPPKPGRGREKKIAPVSSTTKLTPIFQSMTPLKNSTIKYTVSNIVGGRLNETQFHSRANMVSFEKVFHLYDFVVDVHGKNYYHDCIVSCSNTVHCLCLGDSLVVFQSIFRMKLTQNCS